MEKFTIITQNSQGVFEYNEITKEVILVKRNPIVLLGGGLKVLSFEDIIPNYKYPFTGKVIGTVTDNDIDGYYYAEVIASNYMVEQEEEYKDIQLDINVPHNKLTVHYREFTCTVQANDLHNAYMYWAEISEYDMHDKVYRAVVVHNQEHNSDEVIYSDDSGEDVEMGCPYGYGDKKFLEEITEIIFSKTSLFSMLLWRYFNEPDEFAEYFISRSGKQYNAVTGDLDPEIKQFPTREEALTAVKESFYGKDQKFRDNNQ